MSARPAGGRVRRGSEVRANARRPATRVSAPKKRRTSSVSISGQVGKALAALPIPPDLLRRVKNWTLGLFVGGAVVAGVLAMGVPQMVGLAVAHGIGAMGFTVRNIQVTGRTHVDAEAVYAIASDARGQDMPLVDLEGTRARLLQLGWVGDARVSRRLPDTLVVDLVERAPAAILQRNQLLSLMDAGGRVLAPVDARTMPVNLPLLIGPGVEAHVAEFNALVAGQPALKQLVAGGTWIGDRRWDLRFQSGEVVALPEGAEAAKTALKRFVAKDQQARLLGQGYIRIDMRDPKQIVVRTSSEPGSRIADAPPGTVA